LRKLDMGLVYMGPGHLRKFIPGYAKELAADLKDMEVYGSKKS
jgi:hypothetical protein